MYDMGEILTPEVVQITPEYQKPFLGSRSQSRRFLRCYVDILFVDQYLVQVESPFHQAEF